MNFIIHVHKYPYLNIWNNVVFIIQVPIIPVVFSHYCNMDVKERILVPNTATMTVLEPINTNGLHPSKDFDKLMQETRQKMLDVFVKTSKLWNDQILQISMKYVFRLFKVTMAVVAHTYKTLENIYNLPLAAYTYACYF